MHQQPGLKPQQQRVEQQLPQPQIDAKQPPGVDGADHKDEDIAGRGSACRAVEPIDGDQVVVEHHIEQGPQKDGHHSHDILLACHIEGGKVGGEAAEHHRDHQQRCVLPGLEEGIGYQQVHQRLDEQQDAPGSQKDDGLVAFEDVGVELFPVIDLPFSNGRELPGLGEDG